MKELPLHIRFVSLSSQCASSLLPRFTCLIELAVSVVYFLLLCLVTCPTQKTWTRFAAFKSCHTLPSSACREVVSQYRKPLQWQKLVPDICFIREHRYTSTEAWYCRQFFLVPKTCRSYTDPIWPTLVLCTRMHKSENALDSSCCMKEAEC